MAYRLTRAAEAQIDAILLDSFRSHGIEAAGRYGQLIVAAMAALGGNPELPGNTEIAHLPGIRAYPIRLGRTWAEPARRVRAPRHLVVYRVAADGIVDVLALVHDRMVLSRAARRAMKAADDAE